MKIGILGAGAMGSGIAQVFAMNGNYSIYLCDLTEELAEKGKKSIDKTLAYQVKKGKMTDSEKNAILDRITIGTKEIFKDADLIIEAVKENMQIKKETFKELDSIVPANCMFASNTSSLSVTEMSNGLSRPVIGMHFFNPAPVMQLVEVIRGELSTDEQVAKIIEIAKDIGKDPVEVNESAGFAVNRILGPMLNEAIYEHYEGVASMEDIDKAMRLGTNMPMGPFQLADYVGLDICLALMETLQHELGSDKYSPCPLLRKMVRAGKLGVKTGIGFYDYRR